MKTFFELREKTLTPAEKKKREEVAKAIERENPNMPMAKKMAIATATAKKVAEEVDDISSYGNRRLASIANKQGHPDAAAAKNELARRRMRNESLEEGVTNLSHARLKFHATKGVPHGSYSNAEIKDEHKRRMRTEPDYVKAKASMNEEAEQVNELNKSTLGSYIKKANVDAMKHAQKSGEYNNPDQPKHFSKAMDRMRGVKKATDKLVAKEEVEELDELKKSTLGSYVKKASGSAAGLAAITTAQAMSSKGKADKDDKRQFRNRLTGISRATDKLTKEEVELDEVSSSTLGSYISKADANKQEKDRAKGIDLAVRKKHPSLAAYMKKSVKVNATEEVEQVDEISRDLARRYIRKVADKTNTGELSTKEVEKRRPGVNLAGKKAYPGIAGKAKVSATEEVAAESTDLDEYTLSAKAARAGKDIGKPGKTFAKIADKAAKKYGSKEAGQRVAGAILAKMRSKQ